MLTHARTRRILREINHKGGDMMGHGGSMMLVALAMLSLVAGMFLLMKACKEDVCCKAFHKIVAYVVIVLSMLIVICGVYKTVWKYSHHGFGPGREMMGGKEMKPEMMMEMMKNCPMMKMMEKMQEEKEGD